VDHWEQLLDDAFEKWAQDPASAPGIDDPKDRKNLILRLWSGCAGAGKMIDRKTMTGPTRKELRADTFKGIDANAAVCPAYRAGVEYAFDWKDFLGQEDDVVFDGLPGDHLVRRRYNAKHSLT
jgi:hypothetical protein